MDKGGALVGKAARLKQQRRVERSIVRPGSEPDTVDMDLDAVLSILREHDIAVGDDDLPAILDDVPFVSDRHSPSGYRLDIPVFVAQTRRALEGRKGA
jgi:hypothetical protein